jgi:hypothetical protein
VHRELLSRRGEWGVGLRALFQDWPCLSAYTPQQPLFVGSLDKAMCPKGFVCGV